MRLIALHTATLFLFLNLSAKATAHPCEFEVFTPASLGRDALALLANVGISALPASLLGPSAAVTVELGSRALFRDGVVIGQLRLSQDPRHGVSELVVSDSANRPLFSAWLVQVACPSSPSGGPCSRISLWTEIEPFLSGTPAFAVLAEGSLPGPAAEYFKYGKPVTRRELTLGVRAALDWLRTTLLEERPMVPPIARPRAEQARLLFASDPDVAPFLDSLFLVEQGSTLILRGRVPSNYVYNRVIELAREAGYFLIRPWLTIDTGMRPAPLPRPLMACF